MRNFLLFCIFLACVTTCCHVEDIKRHTSVICGQMIKSDSLYRDTIHVYKDTLAVDSVVVYKLKYK